ncbi:ribosome biogenesis GTPase Der [Candidatus Falkowbacteria bacterium CG23_combo_of_CG06-09_8_20_14_all_49_15]|uniref:GTPase Der n=1 Tax=Candidatus Falkowbacteria bacterium CG23_combo_of_CG06-09_8_20_14_all_49_15 TaxID=1974572 RepID=A0A2G9ZL12_9BACT|nr:MAG: ribosome biogenesis GTPase Der [Candidatus Falkowbacteria bacterium CG23_combo_of_CG06-09_8_20_14_all_49_15]
MPDRQEKIPLVVIVGRCNVGKSTLFNRLVEKRQALTAKQAGTTRDGNLGLADWRSRQIALYDTGGLDMDKKRAVGERTGDALAAQTEKNTLAYLNKADLVLLVVDAKDGPLSADKNLALWLKKEIVPRKPVILAANKADSAQTSCQAASFYRLGMGEPWPVSALTGAGTGDLLDLIFTWLAKADKTPAAAPAETETPCRVAIIGKPNVGKSSLINSLLGEAKLLVSASAHTTREPQDILIRHDGRLFLLVDTAGINRAGKKTKLGLIAGSVRLSWSALKKADIVLLVLDASQPVSRQDANLAKMAITEKKGLLLVGNKWDLVENKDVKALTREINNELPFAGWSPLVFVSALSGAKIKSIFPSLVKIDAARRQIVPQSTLNTMLKKMVSLCRPSQRSGARKPHIYEFNQLKNNPPIFSLRLGPHDNLNSSYFRFVENRLRKKFDFTGVPLNIITIRRPVKKDQSEKIIST